MHQLVGLPDARDHGRGGCQLAVGNSLSSEDESDSQ